MTENTPPASRLTLAQCVEGYLNYLQTRHYAKRTVDTRQTHLKRFMAWTTARELVYPHQITLSILERYRRYLYHYRQDNGKPLSVSTQFNELVSLRGYFKWLAKSKVLNSNPASELDLPKLDQRLPRQILTIDEVEQVMMQPDTHDIYGLRDRAILEVLYSTGLRRSEMINLALYDLDADRGTLLVRGGKGGKDRYVPVGDRALHWLDNYLRQGRPFMVIEPDPLYVFLNHHGGRLNTDILGRVVKNYIDQADMGKTGSCHLFRHTMATLMLENGADIRYIQQILGHVQLSTTQIYTQVSMNKLKQVHAQTHPGKLKQPDQAINDKNRYD